MVSGNMRNYEKAIRFALYDISELAPYIASGDFPFLIEIVAQEHGISPDELYEVVSEAGIKPGGKRDIDSFKDKVVKLVMSRLPKEIRDVVQDAEIEFSVGDREVWEEGIEAEGDKYGITIYYPVIERDYGGSIAWYMTVLAHELWHYFSEKTNFYEKLEDLLHGKISEWLNLGSIDVKDFLEYVEFLEAGGVSGAWFEKMKSEIDKIKGWGEEYVYEMAWADRLNGILRYIDSGQFRGVFEDFMAETLARMVTGRGLDVSGRFFKLIGKIAGAG
jgi:hypothetical protein